MMILFSMLLKFSGNYPNNSTDTLGESTYKFFATARNVWLDFSANVLDFYNSYKFKEIIFTLKTISTILSLLFLVGIIFIIIKTMGMGRVVKKLKKNQKRWLKIEKKLNSGQEANYKLAILEADALYDEYLKILGHEKENGLSNINEIKMAKGVRKKIVDDNQYVLTREEAEKSVYAYKKGLGELGVL